MDNQKKMSADEQWRDAYAIAARMYKESRAVKRSELNAFEQLVCDRNDRIFHYDPYGDTFSFRNQRLSYEEPVLPRLRPISDADLDAIKSNTSVASLATPCYQQMTPIHVAPPSTLLVFNLSQPRSSGLTAALEAAARDIHKRPSETDMKPGGEYLYKHKDGKLYRAIILAEVKEDDAIADADRRYEMAFIDVCQIITLKLKHLFLPLVELSLDRFPCNLHCARLRGIAAIRNGYVQSFIDEVHELYNDKARRKGGLPTLVYKAEQHGTRYIIDFPSLMGSEVTESEALHAVHGHLSTEPKDPNGLSYEQIVARQIRPLVYPSLEEEGDSGESDFANISVRRPLVEECPFGKVSVDKFVNQRTEVANPEVRVDETAPNPETSSSNQHQDQLSDVHNTLDDSISLASNRSFSAITPLPTFDCLPPRADATPKKKQLVRGSTLKHSPDGWEEETPKKEKTPMKKQEKTPRRAFIEVDIWGSEDDISPEAARTVAHQKPLTLPQKVEKVSRTPQKKPNAPSSSASSEVVNVRSSRSASETTPVRTDFPSATFLSDGRVPGEVKLTENTKGMIDEASDINRESDVPSTSPDVMTFSVVTRLMPDPPANFDSWDVTSENEDPSRNKVEDQEKHVDRDEHELHPIGEILLSDKVSVHLDDAFHAHKEMKLKKLSEDIRLQSKSENVESKSKTTSSEVSNFSTKSVCPSEESEQRNLLEEEAPLNDSTNDEFAQVPESLKTLADAFVNSARNAAFERNRLVFVTDVHSMESIAIKSSGPLERRFWKTKVDEAKRLEEMFD